MTVPRFFIPVKAIDRQNERVIHSDGALAKQISKVLRLQPGALVDFLDGTGALYHCRLEGCDKQSVIASIQSTIEPNSDSGLRVNLALPPLKSGRFEWALEKLTELGVVQIIPILVERSVVKPNQHESRLRGEKDQFDLSLAAEKSLSAESTSELSGKMTRWQSIVKEAAEQCERTVLPQLVPPLLFADFLRAEQNARPKSVRFICAERSTGHSLAETLCNQLQACSEGIQDITIAIGAEGGFTEHELTAASAAGFVPVSLGKLILRAETAAIYALAIVASQKISKP
jgi:16S rRNA (uracil1498-N3)-methyltransferase